MGKLIHVIKKGVSYSYCIEDIYLLLNDPRKNGVEIRMDKIHHEVEAMRKIDLTISYIDEGGSGE